MKIAMETLRCPVCHQVHYVEVEEEDYKRYTEEDLRIADAFPYLSLSEKEMLISGVCPKCWDELFKGMEDE